MEQPTPNQRDLIDLEYEMLLDGVLDRPPATLRIDGVDMTPKSWPLTAEQLELLREQP